MVLLGFFISSSCCSIYFTYMTSKLKIIWNPHFQLSGPTRPSDINKTLTWKPHIKTQQRSYEETKNVDTVGIVKILCTNHESLVFRSNIFQKYSSMQPLLFNLGILGQDFAHVSNNILHRYKGYQPILSTLMNILEEEKILFWSYFLKQLLWYIF